MGGHFGQHGLGIIGLGLVQITGIGIEHLHLSRRNFGQAWMGMADMWHIVKCIQISAPPFIIHLALIAALQQ